MDERVRWVPLVGRESELARLQVALDQVVAGQGGLVVVSGEPGIGKTRLVEELAVRAAGRGALMAWGRIEEGEGTPPYWPWIQLLGTLLVEGDRRALTEALEKNAGVIAAIVPEVKEFVADVIPPPMLDPAEARFHLHQAIVDFLTRLARKKPLVVTLEDIHWADVASLELVRFVAARVSNAQVLLVLTHRSIDAGNSDTFQEVLATLARLPSLLRVPLSGLSQAEVGRFITQTVDVEAAAATVAAVHSRTEGNPFFVAELARLLASEGQFDEASGREPTRRLVPTGVRDVVRRRLARLPAPTLDILAVGAVIGREFDLSVVLAATERDELDTLRALDPAIADGLIGEHPTSLGRFRFSHALVRDTVYSELSPLRRSTLHARVGEAVESQPDATSRLAELAGHFFHAAPVLGPQRALGYTLAAARAAQSALAYERAEEDLLRSFSLIELLPPGPERLQHELEVLNRHLTLMTIIHGYTAPEVARACARARELSQEIGETEGLFQALNNLGVFHHVRGDLSVAAEFAGQLLTVGRQRSNIRWQVAGHLLLGMAQLHTGQLTASRDNLAAARERAAGLELSAQVADSFLGPHPMPMSMVYSSRATWALGESSDALAFAEEGIRLATEIGHPHTLVFAWYLGTHLQILLGNVPVALAWSERAIDYCDGRGLAAYQRWFRIFRGWALCQQGRVDEVVAEMRGAVAVHLATGARINTPIFLGLLADGEACRGDRVRALELVDQALEVKGEDQLWESDLYRRRGELLLALGPDHLELGVEALRQAATVAAAQGAVAMRVRAEASLALAAPAPAAPALTPTVRSGTGSNMSARERELLALVGRGLTDKEIAGALMISLATVRSHLDRIRTKTGRRRRAELTRLAVDMGLTVD